MPWSGMVEQIRSGNERGAEPLYAAVSDCARARLFQSVDPQMVDDHVQEILIIVLEAIRTGELRDPDCLMGFVRTVTRRQVAMHIRQSIVRRRRLIPVDAMFPPIAPSRESPEARLALREQIVALERVLELICPRDREILIRFYCEDQEPERICREMGLTYTQVRLFKSRALAKCNKLSRRKRRIVSSGIQSTKPLRIA